MGTSATVGTPYRTGPVFCEQWLFINTVGWGQIYQSEQSGFSIVLPSKLPLEQNSCSSKILNVKTNTCSQFSQGKPCLGQVKGHLTPEVYFSCPWRKRRQPLFISHAREKSKHYSYLSIVRWWLQLLLCSSLLPCSCWSVMCQKRDVKEVVISPFSAFFFSGGWGVGLASLSLLQLWGSPAVLPLWICHKDTPSSLALGRARSSTNSVSWVAYRAHTRFRKKSATFIAVPKFNPFLLLFNNPEQRLLCDLLSRET